MRQEVTRHFARGLSRTRDHKARNVTAPLRIVAGLARFRESPSGASFCSARLMGKGQG